METHPIPQQISSYQFRLVGDMTLKQFFQIAGGALFGLLIYATPLVPIIKWPIIIFSGLFGVALAFLPFQERPLEKWIFAFFRSIYSPTVFIWKKAQTEPLYFQPESTQAQPTASQPSADIYSSVPSTRALEEKEKSFLSQISQISVLSAFNNKISTPASPQGAPTPVVPFKTQPVVVPQTPKTNIVVEEKPQAPVINQTQFGYSSVGQTLRGEQITTQQAQFSLEAAPPNPPTVPNTVVGQMVDTNGKIIEGAILEIRDAAGRPVRALKSNKVGHFIVVTPLQNGRYEVVSEKDNYTFDPVSFDAVGTIIPPILIKGKIQPSVAVFQKNQFAATSIR